MWRWSSYDALVQQQAPTVAVAGPPVEAHVAALAAHHRLCVAHAPTTQEVVDASVHVFRHVQAARALAHATLPRGVRHDRVWPTAGYHQLAQPSAFRLLNPRQAPVVRTDRSFSTRQSLQAQLACLPSHCQLSREPARALAHPCDGVQAVEDVCVGRTFGESSALVGVRSHPTQAEHNT